jgi:hypothetical protein
MVTVITFVHGPAVDRNDVAFLYRAVGRQAVYDLLVDRDQQRAWTAVQPEKRRDRVLRADVLFGHGIELQRRNARAHHLGNFSKRAAHDLRCLAHNFDLFRGFVFDHRAIQKIHELQR